MKKNKSSLASLKKRIQTGKLIEGDAEVINELIDAKIEFDKLVKAAKEKIGGKSVIAKLPFGFDIVK
ncbi:MAG TPA: hypothetical protein VFN30_02705 [Chitinophagaceae bacterium]|nr:hypothetical protein [Chitinophagaceae bacterium]